MQANRRSFDCCLVDGRIATRVLEDRAVKSRSRAPFCGGGVPTREVSHQAVDTTVGRDDRATAIVGRIAGVLDNGPSGIHGNVDTSAIARWRIGLYEGIGLGVGIECAGSIFGVCLHHNIACAHAVGLVLHIGVPGGTIFGVCLYRNIACAHAVGLVLRVCFPSGTIFGVFRSRLSRIG